MKRNKIIIFLLVTLCLFLSIALIVRDTSKVNKNGMINLSLGLDLMKHQVIDITLIENVNTKYSPKLEKYKYVFQASVLIQEHPVTKKQLNAVFDKYYQMYKTALEEDIVKNGGQKKDVLLKMCFYASYLNFSKGIEGEELYVLGKDLKGEKTEETSTRYFDSWKEPREIKDGMTYAERKRVFSFLCHGMDKFYLVEESPKENFDLTFNKYKQRKSNEEKKEVVKSLKNCAQLLFNISNRNVLDSILTEGLKKNWPIELGINNQEEYMFDTNPSENELKNYIDEYFYEIEE